MQEAKAVTDMISDVIIIGAGPAGLTAAQYAARANLRVVVLEELAVGGQALLINRLENYPGSPDVISGFELIRSMEEQARGFGAQISFETVSKVEKGHELFIITTSAGQRMAHAVIVASGAKHKELGVRGEKEFNGRGVSYCATCDGSFFKGKPMLVIGGGDAACDEATYLANLSDRIIHIHRRDRFRAQKALAERVLKNKNIEVRFNTECLEIMGSDKVNRVRLKNNKTQEIYEEEVAAVFIFVGTVPRTSFLSGVNLDHGGYIITDCFMETNIKGLFAAGDVRATPFRQIVVAAGEGAVAAHTASLYLDELKGERYS